MESDHHADCSDVTDSESQVPRKPLIRRFQSEQKISSKPWAGRSEADNDAADSLTESEIDNTLQRRRRPTGKVSMPKLEGNIERQYPRVTYSPLDSPQPKHCSLRTVASKHLVPRFQLGNFSLRSPKIRRKSSYFTDNEDDTEDDDRTWDDDRDTLPLMTQVAFDQPGYGAIGQDISGSLHSSPPPTLRLPGSRPMSRKPSQALQKGTQTDTGPERRFYDDFTTVDWVRDTINDSSRVKYIQSIPGFRGRLIRSFDALQDWILISIVAAAFALIAFSIDQVEEMLFDVKFGYCSNAWLSPRDKCTGKWNKWSEMFGGSSEESSFPLLGEQRVNFLFYLMAMLALAFLSVRLTLSTKTSSPILLKDNKPRVFYTAYGSGVAEVKTILSGFVIRRFLGTTTLLYKSVGLVLAVSSGLCLGKEGPYVHLATCVGNIACRIFTKFSHNDLRRRQILAAAASAGVALAFGSPLGGVLFSLEEVSYMFMPAQLFRVFFCAMTSALFLKLLDPYKTGKIVLFEVKYTQDWHSPEIIVFIILGICGGVFGALFCKCSAWWPQKVRAPGKIFHGHHTIEVLVVTLITGIASFSSPYTRHSVAELLYQLASPCDMSDPELSKLCPTSVSEIPGIAKALAWVLLLKVVLTSITFGIKVPAGIYVPSMIIGALFGRLMGLGIQLIFHELLNEDTQTGLSPLLGSLATCSGGALECITPGTYAMIGAGAFMAGVTRMNVTLAVILFELTGSLDYVLPFSIAILVANWVANLIEPKSVYELQIKKNDYPFLDNRRTLAFDSSLADLVSPFPRKLCIDMSQSGRENGSAKVTVGELKEMLAQVQQRNGVDGSIPLIRKDNVVGLLPALELEVALDRISQWYEERMEEFYAVAHDLSSSEPSSSNASSGLRLTLPPHASSLREFAKSFYLHTPVTEQYPVDSSRLQLDSIVCTVSVKDVDITKFHHYYVGVKARETCESDNASRATSPPAEEGILPFEATDLTQFVDRAPLTLDVHSPLTLVQMMFAKLGVRQICVVEDGRFVGVLHKKKFIDFCNNQGSSIN